MMSRYLYHKAINPTLDRWDDDRNHRHILLHIHHILHTLHSRDSRHNPNARRNHNRHSRHNLNHDHIHHQSLPDSSQSQRFPIPLNPHLPRRTPRQLHRRHRQWLANLNNLYLY